MRNLALGGRPWSTQALIPLESISFASRCCSGLCMCVFCCFFPERKAPFYPPALLTWKVTQEKVPWGIVLLLGGGFALAKGCEVTPPAAGCQGPSCTRRRQRPEVSLCPHPCSVLCGSVSAPQNCTRLEDRGLCLVTERPCNTGSACKRESAL